MSAKRVVIIDDHAIVREGLKQALTAHGFEICAEAGSLAEARAQIAYTNPDVIVVDLNLPDGSGLDAIIWARGVSKTIGIIVLTLNDSDEYLMAAMTAGASAYVLKSAPIQELIASISFSINSPLSFNAAGLAGAMSREQANFHLTGRELEILGLLPTGATTKEIAAQLFLSQATIKTHLTSIFRKLDVVNRTAAVSAARRNNLVQK